MLEAYSRYSTPPKPLSAICWMSYATTVGSMLPDGTQYLKRGPEMMREVNVGTFRTMIKKAKMADETAIAAWALSILPPPNSFRPIDGSQGYTQTWAKQKKILTILRQRHLKPRQIKRPLPIRHLGHHHRRSKRNCQQSRDPSVPHDGR